MNKEQFISHIKVVDNKNGFHKHTVWTENRDEIIENTLTDKIVEFAQMCEKNYKVRYFQQCQRRRKSKTDFRVLATIYLPEENIVLFGVNNEKYTRNIYKRHPYMGVIMLRDSETIDFWQEKLENTIKTNREIAARVTVSRNYDYPCVPYVKKKRTVLVKCVNGTYREKEYKPTNKQSRYPKNENKGRMGRTRV